MHSSTSNFERRQIRAAIIVLIALLVLFCVSLEVITRMFYGRISSIRGRIEVEHGAAVAAGTVPHGAAEVLIVGNSLLLLGIDYPELQRTLVPDVKVTRFVVESTDYLDWYYGLRQIFHIGARPAAVVLVLSPRQFLFSHIEGDLFANLMLDRRDLLRVARETHADRTTTTNLFLDTVSDFYGSRAEIRNWILHKVLPKSEQLGEFLRPHAPPPSEDDAAVALAEARMAQMRDLAEQYGTHFILAVPPQLSSEGITVLQRAAAQADAMLWIPLGPGVLPSSDFSDGSHLNRAGAAAFTPALARELRSLQLRSTERLKTTPVTRSDFRAPLPPTR